MRATFTKFSSTQRQTPGAPSFNFSSPASSSSPESSPKAFPMSHLHSRLLSLDDVELLWTLCLAGLAQFHKRGLLHESFDMDSLVLLENGTFSIVGFERANEKPPPILDGHLEEGFVDQYAKWWPNFSASVIQGNEPTPRDDIIAAFFSILRLLDPLCGLRNLGWFSFDTSPHYLAMYLSLTIPRRFFPWLVRVLGLIQIWAQRAISSFFRPKFCFMRLTSPSSKVSHRTWFEQAKPYNRSTLFFHCQSTRNAKVAACSLIKLGALL